MPEEDQSMIKSESGQISDAAALPASSTTAELGERPRPFLDRFLETIYLALFMPTVAFRQLKEKPFLGGAATVIILVNLLEAVRLQAAAEAVLLMVVVGLVGWIILTLMLYRLAWAFGKEIELDALQSVVAFASLPWLFIAPALSVGPPIGAVLAIAVIVWFLVWQFKAAAVALETSALRVAALVPLAIMGGYVAIIWLVNFFQILFSLASST
ncbi:hypothetical protein Pse7367_0680 [Thalassoporum mexicanum PCC 7367]|uniref:hypothetical protein n=1 Tax=Thalassoporum mexicanum TaxID=3457544 RepID=UPI00029FE646|nr:hypothetical protein [Pseudanabaena sp. PCC 7367]AFY68983.1 hypothetical protein Pse7367_0680 [Pseudanabaena sp. PCC 7367]